MDISSTTPILRHPSASPPDPIPPPHRRPPPHSPPARRPSPPTHRAAQQSSDTSPAASEREDLGRCASSKLSTDFVSKHEVLHRTQPWNTCHLFASRLRSLRSPHCTTTYYRLLHRSHKYRLDLFVARLLRLLHRHLHTRPANLLELDPDCVVDLPPITVLHAARLWGLAGP